MACPPSTHAYKPWGDRLFCSKCGSVLGDEPPRPEKASQPPLFEMTPSEALPTTAELEAHIARLREAVGVAQEPEGPMPDETGYDPLADRPKVWNAPEFDDRLPDPGL